MKKEEIRKYQLAQLKLLEYFDAFCRANNLRYFLVFGTLLGAVRHNGFIPWDADIDVAMYRQDYNSLRDMFICQPNPDLFYENYESESNHISPHAMLRIKGTHVIYKNKSLRNIKQKYDGIFIDIFPIDDILDPDVSEREQVKKLKNYRQLVYLKTAIDFGHIGTIKKLGKYVISYALVPITFKYLNKKTDEVMQKNTDISSEYVAILTDPLIYRNQLFERSVFGTGREMLFEGLSLLVPEDAERFLTIRYGEYMNLPPESKRWEYIDKMIDHVDYGRTSFLNDSTQGPILEN